MPRIGSEVVENPYSGRYEGFIDGWHLEMRIDLDQLRKHSKVLKIISGMVSKSPEYGLWEGCGTLAYFRTVPDTITTEKQKVGLKISAQLLFVLEDSSRLSGNIDLNLSLKDERWLADVNIEIGNESRSFIGVERTSPYFREVKLDIDYVDKVVWPTVTLTNNKTDRKIDPFSAFEDAGLKLTCQEADSQKIKDPTPSTPWNKADMYEAMMHYFDETENSDQNIWCMMGKSPPDRRYMGYSFDTKGRHGFGLFVGHSSFNGHDSRNPKICFEASRRLLHYLVHECGHCLGLEHPFESGQPDSLSWMNYAWKYDERHRPGSFYESFKYSFSDVELRALRHSPNKEFREKASPEAVSAALGYKIKSEIPDTKLADDDSDDNEESAEAAVSKKPMRKIVLKIKIRNSKLKVGHSLRFEAKIKNVGRLPVLVERDLSLEGGNLRLYITGPDGRVQRANSFVNPIFSGFTRPIVLYTHDFNEGQDQYKEVVTVGSGTDGVAFAKPGIYGIRAIYQGGRYTVTSDTHQVKVEPENEDHDEDTKSQLSEAISLGSASYGRFTKVREYWQSLAAKAVEHKRRSIEIYLSLSESLVVDLSRQPVYAGKKQSRNELAFEKKPATKSPKEVLKDTEDLLDFMQTKGKKRDNMDYIQLVFSRAKLHLLLKQVNEGDQEVNRMIADLLLRGVAEEVLRRLAKKWIKMKDPVPLEVKYTTIKLQQKFGKILRWSPSVEGDGEPDVSGIGLGRPFNNFREDDIRKGLVVIEMLFNKYYETKDLVAVLSFADKLQKGREVNHHVLHWALEAFVVHCTDAKEAGLKYPQPEHLDPKMASSAAMIATRRTGIPTEDWMNYWRCDADFNYHHRHWHIVYVVGRFVSGVNRSSPIFTNVPPHLERQGELFGYMHAQMVARYDAERESWGLNPVQEWEYNGTAVEFNAGLEFHSDAQFRLYAPRPITRWPSSQIELFQTWEMAYEDALIRGRVFENVEMTPNWSGHVLEPSSGLYSDIYGSIHNNGHGLFGSLGLPPNLTSYMNDTATAVRDSIFYRWHKRIDNLWQRNNNYYRSDIAEDAPPVTLHVMIDNAPTMPQGFQSWNNDWVNPAPQDITTLHTKLGPPVKKFEWDNKISHEPFYYHIRVKRNPGSDIFRELRLTIRLFIVPRMREAERIRYIEMDKFAVTLPSGTDHDVFTRADRHSSVIKRVPDDMTGDFERRFVRDSPGFCECGWPYHMLLPRGTSFGEEYVLYAIATDNNIDSIGIRTTCGSMSFCGARGQPFPDSRNMGYPFSSPITINGQVIPIADAFDTITNGTRVPFRIQNNMLQPPRTTGVDVWWPFVQLGLNDGTDRAQNGPITDYSRSSWTGRFRVLVENEHIRPRSSSRIMLRFQGRGVGGGEYRMRDVQIGPRTGNSSSVSSFATVFFEGASSFTIPEEGLVTDPLEFSFRPAGQDYFVTFTLLNPGVFLRASRQSQTTLTYRIANAGSVDPNATDWSMFPVSNRSRNIYCISGVMSET